MSEHPQGPIAAEAAHIKALADAENAAPSPNTTGPWGTPPDSKGAWACHACSDWKRKTLSLVEALEKASQQMADSEERNKRLANDNMLLALREGDAIKREAALEREYADLQRSFKEEWRRLLAEIERLKRLPSTRAAEDEMSRLRAKNEWLEKQLAEARESLEGEFGPAEKACRCLCHPRRDVCSDCCEVTALTLHQDIKNLYGRIEAHLCRIQDLEMEQMRREEIVGAQDGKLENLEKTAQGIQTLWHRDYGTVSLRLQNLEESLLQFADLQKLFIGEATTQFQKTETDRAADNAAMSENMRVLGEQVAAQAVEVAALSARVLAPLAENLRG